MPDVRIKIENKVASLMDDVLLVCGNSDYTAVFDFDEEWGAYEAKTARFITVAGHQDVVFSGNRVAIPVLTNTPFVRIGVFAGDLHTTTPAEIFCQRSVLCAQGSPVEPPPDVYAQLMQMVNDGRLQGEPGPQGERGEKGEKGDAGSIKFIPVVELPTENIDTNAIYLQKIESEDEQNRFTEHVFIDGKWETIGAITVQVDHSEYVKNTDYANTNRHGVIRTYKGFGVMTNASGYAYIDVASKDNIDKRNSLGGDYNYTPLSVKTLDYAVKVGITTNTETWTDEEKAAACETIGAIAKQANTGSMNVVYGEEHSGNGSKMFTLASGGTENMTIPMRNANGQFDVRAPKSDLNVANKKYVDGLIAELRAEIEALKNG